MNEQPQTRRNYIAELESKKAQEMGITLCNSDNSLNRLHCALSVVQEAIETDVSLEELKDALVAAIKVRRE